jgi:hypothetical protein
MTFIGYGKTSAPAHERVLALLQPHSVGDLEREHVSALANQTFRRPVALWRINNETIGTLHQCFPNGLLGNPTYAEEGWFEDPVLYRDEELMLGTVSHEGEGVLSIGAAEYPLVTALGILTRDSAQWI